MKRISTLILSLGLLASCATMVNGEIQKVTVLTPGARDSECILNNGEFDYPVYPPQTIDVSHRHYDLTVTCKASGNRVKKVVFPKYFSDSAKLNALNAFAPGIILDYYSGALYKYPETITISFLDTPPHQYPLPTYQQDYDENPAIAGVEEFRPGVPSMIRDLNEPIPQMQKKDPNAVENLDLGLGGGDQQEGSAEETHTTTGTSPEGAHTTTGANPVPAPEGAKNPSAADIIGTGTPPEKSGEFIGGTSFLPDDDNK